MLLTLNMIFVKDMTFKSRITFIPNAMNDLLGLVVLERAACGGCIGF